MNRVETYSLEDMPRAQRTAMFRLRYDTFVTRLGWTTGETQDGLEIDGFDDIAGARYIVATCGRSSVRACLRLLPTLGPNMLRDVFPVLLHGQPVPAAADTWELSRLAVAGEPQSMPGPLQMALMRESVAFAWKNGIARYVTVTTTLIEDMLVQQGLHVRRIGPPVLIGGVETVACAIVAGRQTAAALGMQPAARDSPRLNPFPPPAEPLMRRRCSEPGPRLAVRS